MLMGAAEELRWVSWISLEAVRRGETIEKALGSLEEGSSGAERKVCGYPGLDSPSCRFGRRYFFGAPRVSLAYSLS